MGTGLGMSGKAGIQSSISVATRMWRRIYEANSNVLRDPDHLVPGQELRIPAPEASSEPALASDEVRSVTTEELAQMLGARSDLVEAPSPVPTTYTVQPGDTFYGIAMRLYGNGKYGPLLHLRNKHLVPDARRLCPGQRILLLDGVAVSASPSEVARNGGLSDPDSSGTEQQVAMR